MILTRLDRGLPRQLTIFRLSQTQNSGASASLSLHQDCDKRPQFQAPLSTKLVRETRKEGLDHVCDSQSSLLASLRPPSQARL